MSCFSCPYLQAEVELTDERERHVLASHPEFGIDLLKTIGQTLADPDRVARSQRMGNARLFSRWYNNLRGGKYAVVVVVTDPAPHERHWVITAYVAGKLSSGIVEWTKN